MKKKLAIFTRTHIIFVLFVLIFGSIFVCITPPLWGTDETSHFIQAYRLTRRIEGGLYQQNNGIPKNLVELSQYTVGDLVDDTGSSVLFRKDIDNKAGYQQFTSAHFSKEKTFLSWTATYSPVAYAGSIVGIAIAELFNLTIGGTILLARIGSLILYTLLAGLSIRLLRNSKLRWLFFAVATLPIAVFQAAVVTADNMAIGLSLLLVALFIRIIRSPGADERKKLFISLLIVALLLPLVKINYIFLSLIVVLVPNNILNSTRRTRLAKASGISVAGILVLLWAYLTHAVNGFGTSQRPDGVVTIPGQQISFILHHPPQFIAACIRSIFFIDADQYTRSLTTLIGWNYVTLPIMFIALLLGSIVLAAIYAKEELPLIRKKLLILCCFVSMGIFSIFGVLYVVFTPVSGKYVQGVQGRYFLPFLVPTAMTLAAYLPLSIKIKDRIVPYVFVSITVLCLATSVVFYYLATY